MMKLLRFRPRLLSLSLTAAVVAVFSLAQPVTFVQEASPTARIEDSFVARSAPIAEIKFSAPKQYALILHEAEQVRRVYATGAVIFHPQDPIRSVVFKRVDGRGIVLRESPGGREWTLRPGNPVPGFPGVIFVRAILLDELQYQFKVVDRITQDDPILLSVAGSRAILEKEVLHLPPDVLQSKSRSTSPLTSQGKRGLNEVAKLAIHEVDQDTYEVPEAIAMPIIEQAGQMLSDVRPRFTPIYSTAMGKTFSFSSVVGDGTLSRAGFTVTRLPVARTFGIEVGDTIISLNGRPVTSPRNAWWTYQELFIRNHDLRTLRVKIVRGSRLITKTFRIR